MNLVASMKDLILGPPKLQEYMKQVRKETVDHNGAPIIYKVPMKLEKTEIDKWTRFSVGKDSSKPKRTILVLGQTGAGKTTLVNGMINYILGVQREDPFRFVLAEEDKTKSQAESQTSEVNVYKINHHEGFEIDFSLTIIDTPGFGDTRGIERDRLIVKQLNTLFTDPHGVSEIDAVCVVVPAALARLTATQKYVFDSVLSIFGNDIAENIRVLVTFADGQTPPVLEAIRKADIPCPTKKGLPLHFKFNNSALFAHKSPGACDDDDVDDDDDDDEDPDAGNNFDEMFWKMGFQSMKNFFKALKKLPKKSLILTKEVLRERETLEISVESLQKQVSFGLAKLEEIRETRKTLDTHKADITINAKFEVTQTRRKAFQVKRNGFHTNCNYCTKEVTCHPDCIIGDNSQKAYCGAMKGDGYCGVCGCYWENHYNLGYVWEHRDVTTTETFADILEKHNKALNGKNTVEAVIAVLTAEYDHLQQEVVTLMERSGQCLDRLQEIALKPNPQSTPDYIDMLIRQEENDAKPGYKDRIDTLQTMKRKAEFMLSIKKGGTLLTPR